MTPARVRACSRFASRAMNPGASASWRSSTLRFTTMMMSIVVAEDWPDRPTGRPAVKMAAAGPMVSLFDQVNALVQRIGHVAGGVVPFRKIQGRVHAPGDLPQPARRERERAPHRVGLQGAAQAGHRRVGGEAPRRGA